MEVRTEKPGDAPAIAIVHAEAFGRPDEANLVTALRKSEALLMSLVATIDDRVVGHIMFTRAEIDTGDTVIEAAALGPMAVSPPRQRWGIGNKLVNEGLQSLRAGDWFLVVVLGHPTYYPRFGFVPASTLGLRWEHDAPDEAFMALLLAPPEYAFSGIVRYASEFDSV